MMREGAHIVRPMLILPRKKEKNGLLNNQNPENKKRSKRRGPNARKIQKGKPCGLPLQ